MSEALFPTRRPDGSAEVAAVFRARLAEVHEAVEVAFLEWHELVQDTDVFSDLSAICRPCRE